MADLEERVEFVHQQERCIVQVAGEYPNFEHSFEVVTTIKKGVVGVVYEFPPVPRMVENAAEFCEAVMVWLGVEAQLTWDENQKYFFLNHRLPRRELEEYLSQLAIDCDVLRPLIESVGGKGVWSPEAVQFAFSDVSPAQRKRPH